MKIVSTLVERVSKSLTQQTEHHLIGVFGPNANEIIDEAISEINTIANVETVIFSSVDEVISWHMDANPEGVDTLNEKKVKFVLRVNAERSAYAFQGLQRLMLLARKNIIIIAIFQGKIEELDLELGESNSAHQTSEAGAIYYGKQLRQMLFKKTEDIIETV